MHLHKHSLCLGHSYAPYCVSHAHRHCESTGLAASNLLELVQRRRQAHLLRLSHWGHGAAREASNRCHVGCAAQVQGAAERRRLAWL